MKKFCRRFFASLLAGILGLLLLGAAVPAASGETVTEDGYARERILYIHPPSQADAGKASDSTYEIYCVAPLADVLFGKVTLSRTPSAQEISRYRKAENRAAAVKPDASNVAAWNLSAAGYGDGVYLVAEAGGKPQSDPFYVCVPCAAPSGEGWLYSVDVYPRIHVSGPEVDQDIMTLGNDAGTFRPGEELVFLIRGGVPDDLFQETEDGAVYAQSYRLADVLDTGLDYRGSAQLSLLDSAGAEIPLTVGEHYALAEIPAKGGRGARVAVSLTETGMRYVSEHLGGGCEPPELRLSYTAAVNDSAAPGQVLRGNARLEYTDASGYEYPTAFVTGENRPRVQISSQYPQKTAFFQEFPLKKD